MKNFEDILKNTERSMIETANFCHCPGKLYKFAWSNIRPEKSIKRKIDYRARKLGLKTSLMTIYGTSKDWDKLNDMRFKIEFLFGYLVSPISWVPTEDFGLDFFCFSYLPIFKAKDFYNSFAIDNDVSITTRHKETLPLTLEYIWKLESMRLRTLKINPNACYQSPFISSDDNNNPIIVCSDRPKQFKEFYRPIEDTYPEMRPSEFAKKVISDFGLYNDWLEDKKLIVTSDAEKAAKAYGLLNCRLNTSWIINVEMKDSVRYNISFSYDDMHYDPTAGHHSLFYICNNLIWKL